MTGFKQFIREQGIVGFAIAFILGGAVTKLVTAFVTDLVQPLINVVLGGAAGLKTVSFTIFEAKFLVGDFIFAVIDFVVIAAVIYWGFRYFRLDRLDIKKDQPK